MTDKQKNMLMQFADGADVNVTASIAEVLGKREAYNTARTIMALYRAGMLQIAKQGGLEISAKGRAAGSKVKR